MLIANFHCVTNLSELVVYWFLLRWYSVSTPLNAFQGVSEWYLVLKVFYQNCSSKTLCYRGMFQITDSVVVQHFAKDKSKALTRPQVSLRHYITSFRVRIKLRFIKSFIWHSFVFFCRLAWWYLCPIAFWLVYLYETSHEITALFCWWSSAVLLMIFSRSGSVCLESWQNALCSSLASY